MSIIEFNTTGQLDYLPHHRATEVWDVKSKADGMAATIRHRSRQMTLPRAQVEKDILRRSMGTVQGDDIATAEKLS
jgi:hypothetical protein